MTLVVRPVTDSLRLDWQRRGRTWERCGSEWQGEDRFIPVNVIGPEASAQETAAKPYRRDSPGAT